MQVSRIRRAAGGRRALLGFGVAIPFLVASVLAASPAQAGCAPASCPNPGPLNFQSGDNGFGPPNEGAAFQEIVNGHPTGILFSKELGFGATWVNFPPGTTLSQLTTLELTYLLTEGECRGGTPRFDLFTSASSNPIHGYIGPNATFIGPAPACPAGWNTQPNVADTGDLVPRWDASSHNMGAPANTWATILALYGGETLQSVQITVDGGWAQTDPAHRQRISLNNWKVCDSVYFDPPTSHRPDSIFNNLIRSLPPAP